MSDIENKELLCEAVETYDELTKAQKVIMKTILNFEEQGIAKLSTNTLAQLTGYSQVSIYACLKFLEQNNFLKPNHHVRQKVHYLELEKSKLQYLINLHIKKQKIIKDRTS